MLPRGTLQALIIYIFNIYIYVYITFLYKIAHLNINSYIE